MGHIAVDVKVQGSEGEIFIKGLTVDTGATYTVLPKETLERIGVIRLPRGIKTELGDGRMREAEVYTVSIGIDDREGPAFAITFEGAKSVVGVQTLEALGLKVDPTKGALEPTRPSGLAYFYKATIAVVEQP
ncbi:MAG: retroviral-like aspartic protease family protein [Candidatus Bathyarchaeia archaeon]